MRDRVLAVVAGGVLAICNTLVIACVIASTEFVADRHRVSVAQIVILVAGRPALVLGLCLGAVAKHTAAWKVWKRIAMIAVPACGLVVLLGIMFRAEHYIVVACVSTLVFTLVLERTTRVRSDLPRASIQAS